MDKINLVIPCAGRGQRFIDAGYKVYKPGISVFEKPMILHVINAFPEDTFVWIITDSEHYSQMEKICSHINNVKIVVIPSHKNGPAWTLLKAAKDLPQNEACFVAYNDILWKWDFSDVMQFILKQNADGVVFTHTGFHPHLYKNNFSAFCKTESNKLTAIKEKGSFTDNWMEVALSTGVFYYANTTQMISGLTYLVDNHIKSAGEFYPSMLFNRFLEEGLSIFTYETSDFVHVGLPEQLEDAEEWRRILRSSNELNHIPSLLMMCGTGSRMKTVSSTNKADLKIDGIPMYRYMAEKNASVDNIFLVNNETKSLLDKKDKFINIGVPTKSQAESLLLSSAQIPGKGNLLVLSNDCFGIFDTSILKDYHDYKMVVFGFDLHLLQQKQGNSHTGFSFIDNEVTEVHIKSVNQGDLGFAGMYYFPDIGIVNEMKNYDYIEKGSIDHFAKYLLSIKIPVGFITLKHYVHLGTPEEFYEYLFWERFTYE